MVVSEIFSEWLRWDSCVDRPTLLFLVMFKDCGNNQQQRLCHKS